MGAFISHLKRSASRANSQVIELNAYELKLSQYDPATDTYRKKALKERWHRWGETNVLVRRDVTSAFLVCHVTETGHDRPLLLGKWATAEALLSDSGLCRHELRNDRGASTEYLRLTSPEAKRPMGRKRGLSRTLCAKSDVRPGVA